MYYLFGVLYWIFSAVTVITAGTGSKIRNISKPLTIPFLAVFYFLGMGSTPLQPFVLAALAFSTLGDLFLLNQKRKRFFLSGLFSFLVGHIAYMIWFAGSIPDWSLVPVWIFFTPLLYLAASLGAIRLMSGKSRILKVPVVFYIIIISGMNFSTLCRLGNFSGAAFWLPFTGSLLYLFSDTLLGIRNFKRRISQISRIISLTYHFAQFFLILGIIESGSLN